MITHSAILAALAELRTTAEAAAAEKLVIKVELNDTPLPTEPPRRWHVGLTPAWSDYLAAWDPGHSLRWLSWAEQVAAQHHPAVGLTSTEVVCWWCSPRTKEWPCPDLAGLATALGLEET